MGWFENQIEERREADQRLLEDSFIEVAGVVLGRRDGAEFIDKRMSGTSPNGLPESCGMHGREREWRDKGEHSEKGQEAATQCQRSPRHPGRSCLPQWKNADFGEWSACCQRVAEDMSLRG